MREHINFKEISHDDINLVIHCHRWTEYLDQNSLFGPFTLLLQRKLFIQLGFKVKKTSELGFSKAVFVPT